MKALFWLPILIFFTCCPAARAAQSGDPGTWKIANEARQGDCALRLLISSETISSADDLGLRIEAEAPEDWRIEFVNFDPGPFAILEQTRNLFYRADSGRVISRTEYRLEPFLPHDYRIPGARASFIREPLAGESGQKPETAEIESAELVVRVVSAAPDELPAPGIISEPVDLPAQGNLRGPLFGAAGLLVFAACCFWLLRSKMARVRPHAVLSARQIAESRIQSLLESGLVDRKEFPLFFSSLEDVIVSYAGRNGEAGGGSARPQIEGASIFEDGPKSIAWKEFLQLSELVRFAGHEPSGGELRLALDCCAAILKEEEEEAVLRA